MADRRSFWPTVLAGASVSALAAVASSRPWARVDVSRGADVVARGDDVAPLALALCLVALAAWGALLVTRRLGRMVVSVVGLLASLGTVPVVLAARGRALDDARAAAVAASSAADHTVWYAISGAAPALVALLFVVALVKARAWPEMPTRYDAPTDRPPDHADLWRALDEGSDPTL